MTSPDTPGLPAAPVDPAARPETGVFPSVLETARLIGRRWLPEDVEPLYAVYSDPLAMRWVGDGTPITREQCRRWCAVTEANYARRGYGMFALCARPTRQVIGFAGLVHPGDQPDPEIKYALLRSHWGQGLASEVVPALLAYGAAVHGMERIIATVAPANVASQRVLHKAGMRRVAERDNDDGSTTWVLAWTAHDTR